MAAGAYTSVPDVIDYLVATITALPACADPVQVADGWPGTYQAQQMVCVGGGPQDEENSAVREYVVMGNGPNNLEETYEVPIWVRCFQGGTDSKAPRDAAFTIYKAIEAAIRNDPNLGGAISHHYPARLGSLNVKQPYGSNGRAAELRCLVSVRHRY